MDGLSPSFSVGPKQPSSWRPLKLPYSLRFCPRVRALGDRYRHSEPRCAPVELGHRLLKKRSTQGLFDVVASR